MSGTQEVHHEKEAQDLLQEYKNGLAQFVRQEAKKIACDRAARGEGPCLVTAADVRNALRAAAQLLVEREC